MKTIKRVISGKTEMFPRPRQLGLFEPIAKPGFRFRNWDEIHHRFGGCRIFRLSKNINNEKNTTGRPPHNESFQ